MGKQMDTNIQTIGRPICLSSPFKSNNGNEINTLETTATFPINMRRWGKIWQQGYCISSPHVSP